MFNINHIGDFIGLERCQGLLFVYSLSGCDFTPSFFGVGKLSFLAVSRSQVAAPSVVGPELRSLNTFEYLQIFFCKRIT